MTAHAAPACPTCGAPVADGVCVRCLLQAGQVRAPRLPRRFHELELLAELGHGGMGVVYRARELATDRVVALKVLRDPDLAGDDELARFKDEARKAAALDHPSIVKVLHVDSFEGRPYFTMELVEGGTLADRVAALHGHPRAAASIVAEVARAVHYAHQRFVLHRDLKPANILLDARGAPRIADFGVARRLDEEHPKTSGARVMGTLPYMAPEQVTQPRALTVAVDVYGLGAILYELLTGRPPAQGSTIVEIARRVVDVDPPSPRTLANGVDIDLDTICMTCLKKAPAERYASAAGLALDLERWLRDEPIAARRTTWPERALRTLRRHPFAAALVVMALVLLTTTAAVGVSVARAQEDELRADALNVNAYAARALSGAVLFELDHLATDAVRAAANPLVMRILATDGDERAALVRQWSTSTPLSRFDSHLILDADGGWVARVPAADADLFGRSYAWRDYFQGARATGATYVSRAYTSTADGTVRFSIGVPLVDARGELAGVLQSAVGSDEALGALRLDDPDEDDRIAALVARRDRDTEDAAIPGDWFVVLHDGVAHGSSHRMPNAGALARLPPPSTAQLVTSSSRPLRDDAHTDPVPGFAGRWLAGVAPVGGTHFAVIVQTRADAAVAPNERLGNRLLAAGGTALAIAALVTLALWIWHRRRRT